MLKGIFLETPYFRVLSQCIYANIFDFFLLPYLSFAHIYMLWLQVLPFHRIPELVNAFISVSVFMSGFFFVFIYFYFFLITFSKERERKYAFRLVRRLQNCKGGVGGDIMIRIYCMKSIFSIKHLRKQYRHWLYKCPVSKLIKTHLHRRIFKFRSILVARIITKGNLTVLFCTRVRIRIRLLMHLSIGIV